MNGVQSAMVSCTEQRTTMIAVTGGSVIELGPVLNLGRVTLTVDRVTIRLRRVAVDQLAPDPDQPWEVADVEAHGVRRYPDNLTMLGRYPGSEVFRPGMETMPSWLRGLVAEWLPAAMEES